MYGKKVKITPQQQHTEKDNEKDTICSSIINTFRKNKKLTLIIKIACYHRSIAL